MRLAPLLLSALLLATPAFADEVSDLEREIAETKAWAARIEQALIDANEERTDAGTPAATARMETIKSLIAERQKGLERLKQLETMLEEARRNQVAEDQAASQEGLAAAEAQRRELEQLAQQPNAEELLTAELAKAQLDAMRQRYASAAARARLLRQAVELGRGSQADAIAAQAEVDQAFNELRQAEIQSMLDQVRRARAGKVTAFVREASTQPATVGHGTSAQGSGPKSIDPQRVLRARELLATLRAERENVLQRSGENSSEIRRLDVQIDVAEASLRNAESEAQADPTRVDRQVLQAEFFRGYLDTVQQYGQLAADPTAVRVAAVITGADLLADDPNAAMHFLEGVIATIEASPSAHTNANQAVLRVARLQLAEFATQAGNDRRALEELHRLATDGGQGGGGGGGGGPAGS